MTAPIITLKGFMDAMLPGVTVQVSGHRWDQLNGERVVLKAQTKSVCLGFPPGHPKHVPANEVTNPNQQGSWLDWPKRSEVTFDGRCVTIAGLCAITLP